MVFSHTDQVQNISIPAEGKTGNWKAFDIRKDLPSKYLMLSTKLCFLTLPHSHAYLLMSQWHDADSLSDLLLYLKMHSAIQIYCIIWIQKKIINMTYSWQGTGISNYKIPWGATPRKRFFFIYFFIVIETFNLKVLNFCH